MAKFQMVDSTNPLTIADVSSDVDINSFRKDQNWYEIVEAEVEVIKPAKAVKQPRPNKED